MSLYAWVNLAGGFLLINEVLGRAISTGITFGVFVGFVVVLAGELPARLAGFWPVWGRLLAGVLLGTIAGAFTWIIYTWLLLYNVVTDQDVPTLVIGGFGMAIGFALAGTFKLRAWMGVLLSTAILYTFIAFSFYNLVPPFLYFSGPDAVLPQGLMVALAIGLGGYAQGLWRDFRDGVLNPLLKLRAGSPPDTDQDNKRDKQPVPRS
jgi:hypothetical protein